MCNLDKVLNQTATQVRESSPPSPKRQTKDERIKELEQQLARYKKVNDLIGYKFASGDKPPESVTITIDEWVEAAQHGEQ